uniref:Uncharacterized protein n=1 Tax=Timema douglasi TaxID=61478 RepID=A0A7R8Z9D6_TIMDO|nr:unnamed protein product [Timema douglasi]
MRRAASGRFQNSLICSRNLLEPETSYFIPASFANTLLKRLQASRCQSTHYVCGDRLCPWGKPARYVHTDEWGLGGGHVLRNVDSLGGGSLSKTCSWWTRLSVRSHFRWRQTVRLSQVIISCSHLSAHEDVHK